MRKFSVAETKLSTALRSSITFEVLFNLLAAYYSMEMPYTIRCVALTFAFMSISFVVDQWFKQMTLLNGKITEPIFDSKK